MKFCGFTTLFLILAIHLSSLNAQFSKSVYMPRDVRAAYDRQTRDPGGKPGARYFQNQAVYAIRATFEPESRLLTGTGSITYRNNSPDTLKRLYFNLYQNLYKKGSPRDAGIDPVNIHEGVEVLGVSVGGRIIRPDQYGSFSTIFIVPADGGVAPGDSTVIEFSWREKMPVTVAKRQRIRSGLPGHCIIQRMFFSRIFWSGWTLLRNPIRLSGS